MSRLKCDRKSSYLKFTVAGRFVFIRGSGKLTSENDGVVFWFQFTGLGQIKQTLFQLIVGASGTETHGFLDGNKGVQNLVYSNL